MNPGPDTTSAPRNFHLLTLGCKVNQYESDVLRRQCMQAGLAETLDASLADIVLLNTCGVTANAVGKSRRALNALRRKNPRARIIVTGCAVDSDRRDFEIDGVSLVPQAEKATLLKNAIGHSAKADRPECRRARALLKVQDGCNQFCAYCIVPYVRREMWSRPFDEAVAEARLLAAAGHGEIVVAGVRLGLYDGGGGRSLADLLAALDEVAEISRVRFSSLEIGEIDDRLLDAMARSRTSCRHLHLPLQSGDDDVLALMNRPYTSREYVARIRGIREALGRAAITTDVIVGFPGETEEQFENTRRVCREAGFAKIHIFPFSARKPAPAAEMPGRIALGVVRRRVDALAALERELAAEYRGPMLGTLVEVLVEKRAGETLEGKTRDYVTVQFAGSEPLLREIANVRIDEIDGLRLRGSLIDKSKDNECKSKKKSMKSSGSPAPFC